MSNAMFEFIFKYSLVVYHEGQWGLRYLPALGWILVLIAAAVAVSYLLNRRTVAPMSRGLRTTFVVLRTLAILLLLACVLEPYVSVTTIIPKKNTVLVMLDDSESMGIADGASGQTRIQQVQQWLGREDDTGVWHDLATNFNVLPYRFARDARAFDKDETLRANGEFTDLQSALEFAEKQSRAYPVSAVLLVTDGAQTARASTKTGRSDTPGDPLQAAALMKTAGIPIYTIGVGSVIKNDLQLSRVSSTRSVVENDVVEMAALVQSRDGNGKNATVQLAEDGRVIKSEDVALNDKYTHVAMSFVPSRKGFLRYSVKVVPQPGELITSNNEMSFLVNNEDRTARILYVEEIHPWDFKFIKRAIETDNNLQLVSLLRTGPDKFLRQGIRSQDELAAGFPTSRRQLFQYQAIILGSIEASFFSPEQQQLIRDFVSDRGGGLLMLGGPKSFSQGGWQHSAIADILPVTLLDDYDAAAGETDYSRFVPYSLLLTPEGYRSPILQLDLSVGTNRQRWQEMPQLIGYNPVGQPRPGATVLALHPEARNGKDQVIMAEQRYGRGRTMVFATSSSWRWQMHLPSQDLRHERLWRQIGRWLSLSAPEPVSIALDHDTYALGESIPIYITVLDSSYKTATNPVISLQITAPLGDGSSSVLGQNLGDPPAVATQSLEVRPDLTNPERYKSEFMPQQEGLYEVEALVHDPTGKYLGRSTSVFFVSKQFVEFANPDLQEPLLRRVAEMSGGKYFHIDTANRIADELTVAKSSYSKVVERDIWDAPALFLVVLVLLAIEWYTRRSAGLS